MLTWITNWLYSLLVESHIVYHLMHIFGPWYDRYITQWIKTDHVTDDSGCKMNVTKWKGKIVSAFPLRRYETVKDIKIRKDDVFLAGYPKTGCHWMYQILYMLTHKKAEPSKHGSYYEGMYGSVPDIFLDSVPSPRILNSHFLYEDFPTGIKEHKNKIVLTIRCPKDAVVSFYHHTKTLDFFYHYDGTFDDYFNMFMRGDVDYGNYFEHYLDWAKVMKKQQNNPIFFVEFEQLKENPVKVIMELAEFLEIPISQEFAEEVADATSFSTLKKTTKSLLYRKGQVGDWKNLLTKEHAERIDRVWSEKMTELELPSGKNRYCN